MFFQRHEEEQDVTQARALGWASIGIGLAELAATKQVEDLLGIDDTRERRGVLRAMGVREILSGASILIHDEPNTGLRTGVWSRVAGDALDTALLAKAATVTKKPIQFGIVSAMVMGIGLADFLCARKLSSKYSDA